AAAAIRRADLLAIGPGSLYTSLVPNLLIPGIRHAVADSRAPRVLLLNLMTQPGETDGMDAAAHLRALTRHAAEGDDHLRVDVALANSTPLPADLLTHYAESGSQPVTVDRDAFTAAGVELVETDLLDTEAAASGLIRHDSDKLAATVADLLDRDRSHGAGRRPGPRAVAPPGG
ncbi:MAG TPA: 2-phospho-L-lactate transferase CofD family protein, partial [Thermoanaerobaculia bacterium]|nr:2-phospho-L-lactate transferase CofD family protein [Thermoanaerobaculia bacterium]